MDIIQQGDLGSNQLTTSADSGLKFYLNHMASLKAAAVY